MPVWGPGSIGRVIDHTDVAVLDSLPVGARIDCLTWVKSTRPMVKVAPRHWAGPGILVPVYNSLTVAGWVGPVALVNLPPPSAPAPAPPSAPAPAPPSAPAPAPPSAPAPAAPAPAMPAAPSGPTWVRVSGPGQQPIGYPPSTFFEPLGWAPAQTAPPSPPAPAAPAAPPRFSVVERRGLDVYVQQIATGHCRWVLGSTWTAACLAGVDQQATVFYDSDPAWAPTKENI